MLKSIYYTVLFSILLLTGACTQKQSEEQWKVLFNGSNLEGWDTYLGPIWKPERTWETMKNYPAVGLNNDTSHVFSIIELAGDKVLRISGEGFGGISTQQEFENYHLQLKFKWGQKKWYPRNTDKDKRDSGLLYHGSGPHGAGSGFWLSSQEFQIQEGDCGDYWAVARSIVDIKSQLMKDSTYQYDPDGNLITFGPDKPAGNHCIKYPDNEKPNGEWNTLDLYCFNDKSLHVVNGEVTMILENSRELVDGKEKPLTKGKIQLQSEGAEVFYKGIKIKSIDALPVFD